MNKWRRLNEDLALIAFSIFFIGCIINWFPITAPYIFLVGVLSLFCVGLFQKYLDHKNSSNI